MSAKRDAVTILLARSCIVDEGVTSEAQLLSPDNKVRPELYVNSLADFLAVKPLLPSSCVVM